MGAVDTKGGKKTAAKKNGISISALSDEIDENRERIANLEMAQARMEEEFKGLKVSQDAMTATVNNISAKLDMFFAQAEQHQDNYEQEFYHSQYEYKEEHGDGAGDASSWKS